MQDLIAFYTGNGVDHRGRKIQDILSFQFNLDDMENTHDYIQWMFPLRGRSMFNPEAPLLDDEFIAAVRNNETAALNFRRAISRMNVFFMMTRSWLKRSDHNHLRITRIITCIREVSGKAEAEKFFHMIMTEIFFADIAEVNPRSIVIWYTAVNHDAGY